MLRISRLLLRFTKLPLLLTRLIGTPHRYIHVGDMGISHFGHNAFIHELIRGSLGPHIALRQDNPSGPIATDHLNFPDQARGGGDNRVAPDQSIFG